jgi:hypothetical protein
MITRGVQGVLLALVVSITVGCYAPKIEDCTVMCGHSVNCPRGMTCEHGFCSAKRQCGTGDGDGGTDAADGGDARGGGDADAGLDVGDTSATDTDASVDADARSVTDADAQSHGDGGDAENPDAPDGQDGSGDSPADVADADVSTDTPADPTDAPPDVADPADGSDAATPWTPSVIPNLVLWLETDRGIEGHVGDASVGPEVATWRDQSGQSNHAIQLKPKSAPTYTADVFNGMPGLEFTAMTWMQINETASLRWGFGDFLVLVVYRSTGRCEGDCILHQLYRKQEVDYPWRGPGLGIKPGGNIEVHLMHDVQDQWFLSLKRGYDSGRIHLVGAERRSNRPGMRIDGAGFPGPPPPTVVVNMDAPGQHVFFGAHGINEPPYDFSLAGYIGAIVAVKGPISDADLAQLESYLMVKYGIGSDGTP